MEDWIVIDQGWRETSFPEDEVGNVLNCVKIWLEDKTHPIVMYRIGTAERDKRDLDDRYGRNRNEPDR